MASQAFEDFMAQLSQASASLDGIQAEITTIRQEAERNRRDLKEELVEQRRSGKLGKAWKVLQQRIDMNQTTERDIYSGVDKSPEARQVRQQMVGNNAVLRRVYNDPRDTTSDLARARHTMQEALQQLRELDRRRDGGQTTA